MSRIKKIYIINALIVVFIAALASWRSLGRRPTRPDEASHIRPSFVDVAERAGARFEQANGAAGRFHLPEIMSGGVGVLDFDGDGWVDIYVLQGGAFPPTGRANFGDRLFRNRGDGTFEDATAAAGLAGRPGGYGHGVAVGDYDSDGDTDLFATRWGSYALYRNRGDGTFEDVTTDSGLGGDRDWPTSAAWADLDGDATSISTSATTSSGTRASR